LIGRRQVQADHVPKFDFKSRIGRELKSAAQVGFEVVLGPEFLHRAFAEAGVARHGTHAPAVTGGGRLDHLAQDHVDLARVQLAGPSRPGLILQGRQATPGVSVPPFAHRIDVQAHLQRDLLIRPAFGGQPHHPGALPVAVLDPMGPDPFLKCFSIFYGQRNRCCSPRHFPPYP
jgi:hypothetical protein